MPAQLPWGQMQLPGPPPMPGQFRPPMGPPMGSPFPGHFMPPPSNGQFMPPSPGPFMTPRSPRDLLKLIDGAVSEMEADMYMAGMAESAENGTIGSPGKGNVADERLARTVAQERLMTLEDEFAELNMLTDQQAQQNNLCK